MSEQENDLENFVKGINRRRLLYLWQLKSLGYDVNDKIEEIKAEIYSEYDRVTVENKKGPRQWDIDELQLLLSIVDQSEEEDRAKATKAVVYHLRYTRLIMHQESNHKRPHFHIEYKREYMASYAIDTFERLAGEMPQRYEEQILIWASQRVGILTEIWSNLQKGESVQDLIMTARGD